jgi:DNA replication protein DnaC
MSNLYSSLKSLHLTGMLKSIELRISEAANGNISHREFLELVLNDEIETRTDRRMKRYYGAAHFPVEKHLDEFDFIFQPSIKKAEIMELATCKFLTKAENVVFIGQPGTGKTHLSIALGLKALHYGYTVLFTTVWDMITTLQQSRADRTYRKKIDMYLKPDLLILDELGYRSMGETTIEDFFEIVSRRYEKKSIIITSNREFTGWDKIFFDKTLTGALIDRIIHHCHTFIIEGDSYRFKTRST